MSASDDWDAELRRGRVAFAAEAQSLLQRLPDVESFGWQVLSSWSDDDTEYRRDASQVTLNGDVVSAVDSPDPAVTEIAALLGRYERQLFAFTNWQTTTINRQGVFTESATEMSPDHPLFS